MDTDSTGTTLLTSFVTLLAVLSAVVEYSLASPPLRPFAKGCVTMLASYQFRTSCWCERDGALNIYYFFQSCLLVGIAHVRKYRKRMVEHSHTLHPLPSQG